MYITRGLEILFGQQIDISLPEVAKLIKCKCKYINIVSNVL